MAPALTEPLSPTDKLTSSTITARTTPTARSSKKLALATKKPSNNSYLEKTSVSVKETCKYIEGDIPLSSRTTCSKDKGNKHLSLSPSLSIEAIDTKRNISPTKNSRNNGCNKNLNSWVKKNEQMGLSAASPRINNNNINKTINNNITSTSQLLKDLNNETCTTQDCLQDQIKNISLDTKPIEQNSYNNTSPILDLTAHMEAAQQSNKTSNLEVKDVKTEITGDILLSSPNELQTLQYENIKPNRINVGEATDFKADTIITELLEECTSSNQSASAISFSPYAETEPKKANTSKLEIINMEELPHVNTDSTMTASEAEDNLEERLSQLDGISVKQDSPTSSDRNTNEMFSEKDLLNVDDVDSKIRTSTPTEEKLTDDAVTQLQQKTPITSPNSQTQQNTYTPQSITSAMNVLGVINTPQSFIKESNVGELEDQEIEEVFKVLKGIESGASSDLNICDLFNEVYSSLKINEPEIGSNQSNVFTAPPSIQALNSTELQDRQFEIEKRHQKLQQKIDGLTRRMRMLQARYMCKHTSEEIAGLFEWCARQANKCVSNVNNVQKGEIESSISAKVWSSGVEATSEVTPKYLLKIIASRPPATHWNEELTVPVPTTQIYTLLQKIELIANSQQLCIKPSTNYSNQELQNKKPKKSQTIPPTSSTLTSKVDPDDVVVGTLDPEVTEELTQVAGLLHSEMREVQRAIDSDATESSSGGESADEMITFNNQQQQTLPITKRAAWRYSRDRAAIASRWSWVLLQIADLEIKIRQHSDLQQELIRSKGPVTCGPFENGLKTNWNHCEDGNKEQSGSCRTRGYDASQFRKRKLIQTTNIHTISKRAARPSTIKCGCQWPLNPCALCTGRSDPTALRDLPDTMLMSDRIALLDPGYHSVLSFPENVNNALHFEAIARMPEWQQRVMRSQAKHIAKSVWKAEKERVGSYAIRKHGVEFPIIKRKYIRKKHRFNEEKERAGDSMSNTSFGLDLPTSNVLASDVGNGTANLSTISTPTTPLVANNTMKKQRSSANETLTTSAIVANSLNNNHNFSARHIHDRHLIQKTDPYNSSQMSSMICNANNNYNVSINNSKNYKNRKFSNSQLHNHPPYTSQQQVSASGNSFYSSNSYGNMPGSNGDISFLHSNDNWNIDSFTTPSRTSSPTYGSGGGVGGSASYHKYERLLDRKNRASYDIDNIVIPYSVAAATRVEILPYKEIPTPKWRLINDNDVVKNEVESNGKQLKRQQQMECTKGSNKNSPPLNGLIKKEEKSEKIKDNDIMPNGKTENINRNNHDNVSVTTPEVKSEIESFHISNINEDQNKDTNETNRNHLHSACMDKREQSENKQLQKNFGVIGSPPSFLKIEEMKNEIQSTESALTTITTTNNYDTECVATLDEDISDEAMIQRHERALTEERRKFQTYLKFPWSTRSRANRRIDSRAESSGANTPDPSSPAPHTPHLGGTDHDSVPSPVTAGASLNQLEVIQEPADISTSFLGVNLVCSKRHERRRTTSSKRDRELERRSSTPESKEIMPPFEPLLFPLNDEQYEELLRNDNCDQVKENHKIQDLPSKYLRINNLKRNHRTSNYSNHNNENNNMTRRQKTINNRSIGLPCERNSAGGKSDNSGDVENSLSDKTNDLILTTCNDNDDGDRHHLVPPNDKLHGSIEDDNFYANVDIAVDDNSDSEENDNEYTNPVKRRKRKHNMHPSGGSDGESTDTEPFQDDDPNDPEWRGDNEERSTRKKV